MSLKKAILDVIDADRLHELAAELASGRPGGARNNPLEALSRAPVGTGELLGRLDDEEVRSAAAAFQVRTDGRREAIIERLMEAEAYRDSGSEIALYDDAPFVALALRLPPSQKAGSEPGHLAAARVEGRSVGDVRTVELPATGAWSAAFAELEALLGGIGYFAAHDATKVERALLAHDVGLPSLPFQSTTRLARRVWRLERARLLDVAVHLALPPAQDVADEADLVARAVVRAQRDARCRCGR